MEICKFSFPRAQSPKFQALVTLHFVHALWKLGRGAEYLAGRVDAWTTGMCLWTESQVSVFWLLSRWRENSRELRTSRLPGWVLLPKTAVPRLGPSEGPQLPLWSLSGPRPGSGFTGDTSHKEPTCQWRRCKRRTFNPWVWKIPGRRAWQPTPVLLPGESHGQRSLVGYGPWDCKETRLSYCARAHTHTHMPGS